MVQLYKTRGAILKQTISEEEFIELLPQIPNIVIQKLSEGKVVSYRSQQYPDLLLREYPDGRLESIDIDISTGNLVLLCVLKEGSNDQ